MILALSTRTRIDFYEHLAIGVAAALVGFIYYKLDKWSNGYIGWRLGDVKLLGVVGVAFGTQTPYVVLLSALLMMGWYLVRKQAKGLPLGVPVAAGVAVYTLISLSAA